jgi:hypothetical protein
VLNHEEKIHAVGAARNAFTIFAPIQGHADEKMRSAAISVCSDSRHCRRVRKVEHRRRIDFHLDKAQSHVERGCWSERIPKIQDRTPLNDSSTFSIAVPRFTCGEFPRLRVSVVAVCRDFFLCTLVVLPADDEATASLSFHSIGDPKQ